MAAGVAAAGGRTRLIPGVCWPFAGRRTRRVHHTRPWNRLLPVPGAVAFPGVLRLSRGRYTAAGDCPRDSSPRVACLQVKRRFLFPCQFHGRFLPPVRRDPVREPLWNCPGTGAVPAADVSSAVSIGVSSRLRSSTSRRGETRRQPGRLPPRLSTPPVHRPYRENAPGRYTASTAPVHPRAPSPGRLGHLRRGVPQAGRQGSRGQGGRENSLTASLAASLALTCVDRPLREAGRQGGASRTGPETR